MQGRGLVKEGGGSHPTNGAFITEVKNQDPNQKKIKKSALTLSVRKDYAKLQDVVQHFAKKVDLLVDKQRNEYLQAYEHHMSDVQRELFNLREKATAIANDTTREEKIQKLDSDQKWFRNEAMRLDIETNEFRKKMRSIKVTIQSTERERDWLLEKLRGAKDKYKKLKQVRNDLFERYGGALDGGFSVGSNDSSYTLELQQTRNGIGSQIKDSTTRAGNWREQLQRDYLVTRGGEKEGAAKSSSSTGGGGGGGGGNNKTKKKREEQLQVNKNSIQLKPLTHHSNYQHPTKREEEDRKELLAALVKERAKADGIRDLIGQCYNCAAVGSWGKLRRRDLGDVLQDCHDLLSDQQEDSRHENITQRRHLLIQELVNYPEVYDALNRLLSQPHPPSPPHSRQSSRPQHESFGGSNPPPLASQEDEGPGGGSGGEENHNEAEELEANNENNLLCLSKDVLKYFNDERTRREELEIDERSRRFFGG